MDRVIANEKIIQLTYKQKNVKKNLDYSLIK